jgi:hypothetical protein
MKISFIKIILLLLVLFSKNQGKCQSKNSDTVVIGSYISSIHNINIPDNYVEADIYLWCRYNPQKKYSFDQQLEFNNCNSAVLSGTATVLELNQVRFCTKAQIQSRQNFSIRNFPFDKQRLIFPIESSYYTSEELIFRTDDVNSGFDSNVNLNLNGWRLDNHKVKSAISNYVTSFGASDSKGSSYARYEIIIDLSRKNPWLIFLKLILGAIISYSIAICSFWISPVDMEARLSLCMTGIFGAVGNKYITESIQPSLIELTLIDRLHNITFVAIFLIIILIIMISRLSNSPIEKNKVMSEYINNLSFYAITILYTSVSIIVIISSQ